MKSKSIMASILFVIMSANLPAQTGGTFDLSHNVIGGGGGQSTGGAFSVEGTAGQNLAGTLSGGGAFRLRGGFWAFDALAPTAASASISGRVSTASGQGIRSVVLVLTNATTGEIYHAISSSFGYYRFDEIAVGQTYILTANSKRYAFDQNTRTISLLDDLTGVDFTAMEIKQ